MVKFVYKNNNPFIEINGELLPPAAFRSFRPTPANIAMFARCGVRFYQMLISGLNNALNTKYSLFGAVWKGPQEYDFTAFDRQMAMFQEFAPDGYFNVMIQLDTPEWWTKAHPDVPPSFDHLGQALISEQWRTDAADYLQAFIRYAEEKYGDRIYAYSFSCGYATEWFSQDLAASTPP